MRTNWKRATCSSCRSPTWHGRRSSLARELSWLSQAGFSLIARSSRASAVSQRLSPWRVPRTSPKAPKWSSMGTLGVVTIIDADEEGRERCGGSLTGSTESRAGWVAIAATVAFVLFVALVLPAQPQIETVDGAEVSSPDLSLWYTAEQLYETAEAYGPEGRDAYVRARITFDVLWPLVYVAFLATTLSWVYRARGDTSGFWRRANLLPVAAGLLDYAENVCTATVMFRYPLQTPLLDSLAAVFTVSKWLALTASFGALLVGVVSVLWLGLRRRNSGVSSG